MAAGGELAVRDFLIRPAREEEADLLSQLALRSKAHWGYDAEFMRRASADLTITPPYIRANRVFVAEDVGAVAGYYALRVCEEWVELDALFVAPERIGYGFGAALWRHAVATARQLGAARLRIDSDPFAEGFYLRMGARRIGEVQSPIGPGRMLPLLEYTL
jgi:GNAT superfamily N-acetyltransferase